jgi:hypothetical protein
MKPRAHDPVSIISLIQREAAKRGLTDAELERFMADES